MPSRFERGFALTALLLGAYPAHGATWHVAPDGTGDAPTIQAAVDAAADGDEILLEDGTFTGAGNRDVDYSGKNITIRSVSGDRNACVVDCEDESGSGFRFDSGAGPTAVLADLTIERASKAVGVDGASPTIRNVVIRNGRIPVVGVRSGVPLIRGCLLEANTVPGSSGHGVVHIELASATVENCTFRDNGLGGAASDACVTVLIGTATIRGCDFSGNSLHGITFFSASGDCIVEECSFSGGGHAVGLGGSSGAHFTVRDCDVNSAGQGVSAWGQGTVVVEACRFLGNSVWGYSDSATISATIRDCVFEGGNHGLYVGGNSATIERCTIRGSGYGIRVFAGSTVDVRDCLVTGNQWLGVAISTGTTCTVERCTIASNGSGGAGAQAGGLSAAGPGTVEVRNSILWGNCRWDGSAMDVYTGTGMTIDLECVTIDPLLIAGPGSLSLTDTIGDDPLFCDPLPCSLVPTTGGIYGVAKDSPALGQACGEMGVALPHCSAVSVGADVRVESWGLIKVRYRE